MTPHRQWEELAAGHAVDALEPDDEQQFVRHVAGCALCERALADWREVAGQLAYAVAPARPPAGVWQEVVAEVTASDRPAVFAAGTGAGRRQIVTRLRSPWIAAAVAAVLFLATASWIVTVRTQRDLAEQQASRLRALAGVVTAPDTRRVELSGAGTARASAYVRAGSVWLVVDGLARNDPRASVYALWWEDAAGSRHAVAKFDVVADGLNVFDPMPLPAYAEQVVGLAISLEPGRRTPERPSGVLVSGRLPD